MFLLNYYEGWEARGENWPEQSKSTLRTCCIALERYWDYLSAYTAQNITAANRKIDHVSRYKTMTKG